MMGGERWEMGTWRREMRSLKPEKIDLAPNHFTWETQGKTLLLVPALTSGENNSVCTRFKLRGKILLLVPALNSWENKCFICTRFKLGENIIARTQIKLSGKQ